MEKNAGIRKSKKADMNFLVVTIILALIILLVFLIFPSKTAEAGSKFSEFACKYVNIKKACKTVETSPTTDPNKNWVFDPLNLAIRDDKKFTEAKITEKQMTDIISSLKSSSGSCIQKLTYSNGVSYLFKGTVDGKSIYLKVSSGDKNPITVITAIIDAKDTNLYNYGDMLSSLNDYPLKLDLPSGWQSVYASQPSYCIDRIEPNCKAANFDMTVFNFNKCPAK
jgi:hypothetical protein